MSAIAGLLLALTLRDATAQEDAAPKGLLGIAAAEAKRSERVLLDKIRGALRSYALARDTAADRGKSYLDAIAQSGADAVPLLLDLLRGVGNGTTDASFAGPIARALAAIFDQKQNVQILKELALIARSGSGTVRTGVLEGLESLDHPMVIEIVGPLLQESDPALKAQVVRVLGRQKGSAEFVGALLRPLLQQEGAPWAETLEALRELDDRGGIEAAQAWVAKSADPVLLAVSVRYLADLGGKTAIPVLRTLLTHGPPNLADALLKKAIDAVQRIGVRDLDAKKSAEDLLVDVFKRHGSAGVRDWARWQLGPFENEEALKNLEDQVTASIKQIERSGRGTTAELWLELAEDRLQFLQYQKALEALNGASRADERGLRGTTIEPLKAVAHCGRGKLSEAAKILRTLSMEERVELLARYPVIEKLARDPNYRDLFPPAR